MTNEPAEIATTRRKKMQNRLPIGIKAQVRGRRNADIHPLDHHIRMAQGRCRGKVKIDIPIMTAALCNDSKQGDPLTRDPRSNLRRELRLPLVQQIPPGSGTRPRNDVKLEMRGHRQANFAANEVTQFGIEMNRLAGLSRTRWREQNELVFVAEGLEALKREAPRRWPLERANIDIPAAAPISGRWKPGIAGRSPIGLPPWLQPELQAKPKLGRRYRIRDQPHRRPFIHHPV